MERTGPTQDTLHAFFDFLGPERTVALEGICCDMWQPYIDVIHVRAGQAVLVFDKFHIVSHLMTAVDQVRRDEIREKGPAQQVLMHKTRFIWLKNPWNLTERQHRRLSELQRLNLKINRAYLLKETFAHFWDYRRAGWAKRYLTHWFWWATHSRLPPLRNFAWMLRRHERDILNYFRMPIDNGTVEGLNNKAKLIIHRAYGFRTAGNYIRNLYHCMAPAFGGGPARRQPVPPQGAEARAFTGQRTMNTRGTRPGLSPTFYRWAEPSLTVQPLGTGRPLVISAVYRGPDFPRACSSSPDTDGVLQPRKSMTMFDLLAMEPAKAAPIPERNQIYLQNFRDRTLGPPRKKAPGRFADQDRQ